MAYEKPILVNLAIGFAIVLAIAIAGIIHITKSPDFDKIRLLVLQLIPMTLVIIGFFLRKKASKAAGVLVIISAALAMVSANILSAIAFAIAGGFLIARKNL